MTDPVLAKFDNGLKGSKRLVFKVKGGLNYIRGNSSPHFSLTASGYDGESEFGGCCHDVILEHFPQFADLTALHLSDIWGVPMHAEANGWYWLAGAMGGAGEKFHGGSDKTPAECLQIFADHCRVNLTEAANIRDEIAKRWNWPDMRTCWRQVCEDMRPRWRGEAKACITKHNLVVYGDPWNVAA